MTESIFLPVRCSICMLMWNSSSVDDCMRVLRILETARGKTSVFYEADGFSVFHYEDGVLDNLYDVLLGTPIDVYLYENMQDLLDEHSCETEEQLKHMWDNASED